MSRAVAILELPGTNCERESARAVEMAGGVAAIVRWNEPAEKLADFGGYILPGGFSYQDRIRAGAVAARLPLLDLVARRAAEGAPVLGICNGAQVLVEAGLVPGTPEGRSDVVLAPNRMPGRDGYYTRWVLLGPGRAARRCIFTRELGETPFTVPMAHGEGRFWTRDAAVAERLEADVALTYRDPAGFTTRGFPWNPNGSLHAAAGITNAAGNVLALMPHPERAVLLAQVPPFLRGSMLGNPDDPGPGLAIFRALVKAVNER
jgi:phosphoribosylformylglycinamidine synthase subunit PurQ / glutaminase